MKNIIERFEKDVDGSFNTLLILGIILEGERVWTYQIKNKFKKITGRSDNMPTSSFYSVLNKLEYIYESIVSEKDDSVQRRYYLPTKKGLEDYKQLQEYWINMIYKSKDSLEMIQIKDNLGM